MVWLRRLRSSHDDQAHPRERSAIGKKRDDFASGGAPNLSRHTTPRREPLRFRFVLRAVLKDRPSDGAVIAHRLASLHRSEGKRVPQLEDLNFRRRHARYPLQFWCDSGADIIVPSTAPNIASSIAYRSLNYRAHSPCWRCSAHSRDRESSAAPLSGTNGRSPLKQLTMVAMRPGSLRGLSPGRPKGRTAGRAGTTKI